MERDLTLSRKRDVFAWIFRLKIMSFQFSFLLTKQTGILLFALAYAAQGKDIPQQGKAQVEMHSHAGTDLRCTEGDALADHDSDQPHSYHSHLAPERPFTQSFAPDLSFLSCCSSITFLFLLSPASKTLAQLLWHVHTWEKEPFITVRRCAVHSRSALTSCCSCSEGCRS